MALWERLPEETVKAFEAFACYRDMSVSERSYANVIKKLNKNKKTIEQWAVKYQWQIRIKAWQDYLDKTAVAATIKSIEDIRKEDRERERTIGLHLVSQAAKRLAEAADEKKGRPLNLPANLIPFYAKTGLELIRTSDGLSTGKTEIKLSGDKEEPVTIKHELDPETQELLIDLFRKGKLRF